ncbi:redoxin domain-containing protein [Arthrobacter sp. zg-Y1219]|uniref:redoxin domain-containing protein n=1 Tax=Arthrobacter sp. zg-Y1219 TaxID=3049067 RepID=UPI0024C3D339|nr:redoxin domain-containing protein [Arthrobacter sp. zg-Y1219]MDK1359250.1 redoxin domain-containing protein [Arthrobacter sp. zg-Y1219]
MRRSPVPAAAPQRPAPDFSLPNQFGEPVSLSVLRGTPVVLVFYPFAFSGVCTGELDELQGARDEIARAGARLLAVSCDSKYALRAYAQQRGYSFDLLADFWPHGQVADAYQAFDADLGRPVRASFIIDGRGLIHTEIRSDPGTPRPLQAYLDALKEMPSE